MARDVINYPVADLAYVLGHDQFGNDARGLAVKAGQDAARAGSYLGQVGTHCYVHNSFLSTHKQSMCRTSMFARDIIARPRLVFGNFYVEGVNFTEAAPGAPAEVRATIEYPTGVFTQVLFSGASSGTIPDGGIITSDEIPISIPQGMSFWVRSWINCAAGVTYTGASYIKDNPTLGDGYTSGATTSDLTMGGIVTSPNSFWAPPLGLIAKTRKPSFLLIGDSRTAGYQAAIGSSGVGGVLKVIGLAYAHINAARASDLAVNAAIKSTKRFSLGAYVSDIVWAYGINDIVGGYTASALLANTAVAGAELRRLYPDKRLWLCTLPPVTNAGNTATVGSNASRVSYNDAVRACPDPWDGVLDLADATESARNSGLWAPGAGDATNTSDGTHLTLAGNDLIAASGFVPAGMFLP